MTNREPITCQDTTWLVSDSCERELTAEEKADLHGHIATCELCQGASKQFDVLFQQIRLFFSKETQVDGDASE